MTSNLPKIGSPAFYLGVGPLPNPATEMTDHTEHERALTFVRRLLIALLPLISVASGCYGPPEAVKRTIDAVVKRHNAYIAADGTLSTLEKRIYTRDGEVLTTWAHAADAPSASGAEDD